MPPIGPIIGRHGYRIHAPPIPDPAPTPAGCGPGRRPCPGGSAGGRQGGRWLLLAEGLKQKKGSLSVPLRVSTRDGKRLTIRLACIDAPEMAQGAPGHAARDALAGMVQSGPLEIKPQTTDKYGRTVAEVFVGGRNVNLELVRHGHAFAYRKYLAQCDQAAYLGAEAWAEQYGQGVWRFGTERPWDFRQRRGEGK